MNHPMIGVQNDPALAMDSHVMVQEVQAGTLLDITRYYILYSRTCFRNMYAIIETHVANPVPQTMPNWGSKFGYSGIVYP